MGLPAATWARADGARGARNWGTAAGRRCHFVCDGHRMGTAAAMGIGALSDRAPTERRDYSARVAGRGPPRPTGVQTHPGL